jgi:uracil phosphoribosyltransferase
MELFTQVERAQLEQIQTALVVVVQVLQATAVMLQVLRGVLVDLVVAVVVVLVQLKAQAAQEFFTFSIRMELL